MAATGVAIVGRSVPWREASAVPRSAALATDHTTHALAIAGQTLLVGVGDHVVALGLDGADLSALRVLGQSPPLSATVQAIAVTGGRAYVGLASDAWNTRTGALAILDITDAAHIGVLAQEERDVAVRGIAFGNGVALLAGPMDQQFFSTWSRGTVDVVDISGAGPVWPTARIQMENQTTAVVADGDAAYALELRSSEITALRVLDITDPAHPTRTALLPLPGWARDMVLADRRLYVPAGSEGLWTFALDSPTAPRSLGRPWPIGWCADFVAPSEPGLAVVDQCQGQLRLFATPADGVPVSTGTVAIPVASEKVLWPAGAFSDRVFVARGSEGGVAVVDVRRQDAPIVRAIWSPGTGTAVAAAPGVVDRVQPAGARPRGTIAPVYLPYASRSEHRAQSHESLRMVGYAGGPSYGVAVHGDLVYRGEGGAVVVLDARDPGAVVEVGRSFALPGLIFALTLADGRLYAAASEYGLAVFDLAEPARPRLVGHAPTGDAARDVAVEGTLAYVAAGDAGLEIYDVADPARPRRLSATPFDQRAWRVAVHQDHAYVSRGDSIPAVIVDVGEPARPRQVGVLGDATTGSLSVAFYGRHAYSLAGPGHLCVYDVVDPTRPELVHEASLAGPGADVALVAGDRLLLVGGKATVFDLSDPAHPAPLGQTTTGWHAHGAVIEHGRLVLDGQGDLSNSENFAFLENLGPLVFVDLSDPAAPRVTGQHWPGIRWGTWLRPTTSSSWIYYRHGGRAGEPSATYLVDVTRPGQPFLGPAVPELDEVAVLEVDRGIGLGRRDQRALAVLDLADPAHPRELATLALGVGLSQIVAADGLAYVLGTTAEGEAGRPLVSVVDVREPTAPRLLGRLALAEAAGMMARAGQSLWLPVNGGVQGIDVTDPTHPRLAGRLALPGHQAHETIAAVRPDRLWLGLGTLAIVDIRDPDHPRWIDQVAGPYESLAVLADGRVLASACYWDGVGCGGAVLLEVASDGSPRVIGEVPTLPFAPTPRNGSLAWSPLQVGRHVYGLPTGLTESGFGLAVFAIGSP